MCGEESVCAVEEEEGGAVVYVGSFLYLCGCVPLVAYLFAVAFLIVRGGRRRTEVEGMQQGYLTLV